MNTKTSIFAFTVIAVVFLCILLMAGVLKMRSSLKGDAPHQKSSMNPANLTLLEMQPQRFEDTIELTGTVHPIRVTPLRFEIGGVIELMEFKVGDKIKTGDAIARLNQRELYLKLKKTRLRMEQLEKLICWPSVSKVDEDKKAFDLAQLEFEKTVLRCPWDGVLLESFAVVGQTVTPTISIGTLGSIERVLVAFYVPENEISRLSPDNKVVFTHDAYPNVEFTGSLNRGVVPSGARVLETEFRNDGALLLPGMIGPVKITIFEQAMALFIPNEAVQRTSTGNRVFVANKDNKAEVREVVIGYVSPQYSIVSEGLAPDERVITPFPYDLRPGATVTPSK